MSSLVMKYTGPPPSHRNSRGSFTWNNSFKFTVSRKQWTSSKIFSYISVYNKIHGKNYHQIFAKYVLYIVNVFPV